MTDKEKKILDTVSEFRDVLDSDLESISHDEEQERMIVIEKIATIEYIYNELKLIITTE
jgi:hypothetical protein